jgi:phosphatidylserine/phosphatidylglycerophosphate/cardiolipin synthase-like enzyme
MRLVVASLALLAALLLGGCAGVLPQVERAPSRALVAPPSTPLASLARDAGVRPGESGVWPMHQAAFALDARLALIENATASIDLQYYLIADDSTGRAILRALRDAARRGVRVRLLVDDLYTGGLDNLLLGLASEPHVQVRLFNPFITARDSSARRLLAMALSFKRLNHRMHNKMFIADGSVAVLGGRNLADEYFLRGQQANFIDFDLLAVGDVVGELNGWFDLYWNSEQVYPIADIVRATNSVPLPADELRSYFERRTLPAGEPGEAAGSATHVPEADAFGAPPLRRALAQRRFNLLHAEAHAYADSPRKIDPDNNSIAVRDTLAHRFLLRLDDAHEEVLLVSPYFIPGPEALAKLKALREQNVQISVVTNSLAVSDEPLVSIGLERHQMQLLRIGVNLYELSSTRLKLDNTLRNLLGSSTGRLHAKVGLLDRRMVLLGSMNLDPRSSNINTEIGMLVYSPELAEMITDAFKIGQMSGVYQVKLKPNGSGVRWTAVDGDSREELDIDPDTNFWQRVRLMLMSLLVPEGQL